MKEFVEGLVETPKVMVDGQTQHQPQKHRPKAKADPLTLTPDERDMLLKLLTDVWDHTTISSPNISVLFPDEERRAYYRLRERILTWSDRNRGRVEGPMRYVIDRLLEHKVNKSRSVNTIRGVEPVEAAVMCFLQGRSRTDHDTLFMAVQERLPPPHAANLRMKLDETLIRLCCDGTLGRIGPKDHVTSHSAYYIRVWESPRTVDRSSSIG